MPQIKITTDHPASEHGQLVCLLDGKLVSEKDGIRACLQKLGWSQREFGEHCGKKHTTIEKYAQGLRPVPAEVWLVLRESLTGEKV